MIRKNIGPNKGDKKNAVRFTVCSMYVHTWAHSPPSENWRVINRIQRYFIQLHSERTCPTDWNCKQTEYKYCLKRALGFLTAKYISCSKRLKLMYPVK